MSFLKVPYIPDKKVSTVMLDYRADAEIESNLRQSGIDIIKTVPCTELYDAIMGHPDIVMHQTAGDKIVIAPNVFDSLAPILLKKGFAVTKGATWLGRNYPENIAYNVLRLGSYAFHNTKYTDRMILEDFEAGGIQLIHVNQGYTKCSVCIVDHRTIITSDLKLSKAAEKVGIESLLIKSGGILLPGMSYGFVGGAGGLLSGDCLAFTGSLSNMDDRDKIIDFLSLKGITVKILSGKQIIDIGSIIPLTY